jgi:hypothetical protein
MSVVSCSVSQECTASSFRVTDKIQVDVEGVGGKKMCQLHRAVWGSLFRTSELTEDTTSCQQPSHELQLA